MSFARNKVKEVAEELGILPQQLSIWRSQYRENKDIAFPGNGNLKQTEAEKELAATRRELRDVTMERDILKKRQSASFPQATRKICVHEHVPKTISC